MITRWLEACLREKLPATIDLEENLRNGVYLAKLCHFIAPDVLPYNKIYDPEQRRYAVAGLQFRHTDNINHFITCLKSMQLPLVRNNFVFYSFVLFIFFQYLYNLFYFFVLIFNSLIFTFIHSFINLFFFYFYSFVISFIQSILYLQTFQPETTDIYDKKNMPRVIYCIHALSTHLFKMGIAPQIQDLYGKVNFTGNLSSFTYYFCFPFILFPKI